MNHESRVFGLTNCAHGAPAPVLTGVQANGRLNGVLFELKLRQCYRNTSDGVLEVVYTFPLPTKAVLLGFASELNGERKVGAVVAKQAAERQYEKALAGGDAPVMVEALGDGLHTANIGNLKPGDELVLEVRYAQVLVFEQGRVRLAIPTTIAPRFGSAEQAGLQPQQVPQASPLVEYPLALSVTIGGALTGATVECPTHQFTQRSVEGGLQLDLAANAWLDRDVVIVVRPREAMPSLVIRAQDTVADAAPVVVMAALQPPLTAPRKHIALKLLVDCSGSMGGDSIASARVALQGALAGLTEHDQVSLSRFGSTVEHVLAPSACTPQTMRRLKPAVDAINADLGGTEMKAALKAVFELPVSRDCAVADVLLVTDGQIWQAQEMIDAASRSGHRVFAIGVGSSPAESVLRTLAEATGGACEFATPGEALEAAAGRMLVRIRQQLWRSACIDWGSQPVWQTRLPNSVLGGDTVIAFAGMPSAIPAATVRLLAMDAQGVQTECARGQADAPCPGDTLPRIAAAMRITIADEAAALELAVSYQLMSRYTNCILVHERADAAKATEVPQLHRVSSMLAAGWGATSTVQVFAEAAFGARVLPLERLNPTMARPVPAVTMNSSFDPLSSYDLGVPAFVQQQVLDEGPASLKVIALAVTDHLAQGGPVQALPAHCHTLDLHPDVRTALDQIVGLGFSEGQALLLLAHWVNGRTDGLANSPTTATLKPHLDMLDEQLVEQGVKLCEQLLGNYTTDAWTLSRTQRLQRSLGRLSP